MHRLRAPRPLLERPERRTAEREKRLPAKIARQRFDHPPAPAVERIVGSVSGLRARGERAPPVAPGHAGEHDGANVCELAPPLVL